MKFFKKNGIYLIFIVLISLCCIVNAQDGDNAKRAGPRRPIGKSAKTTTTAAPADDEGDYPDGENPDQYGEEGEEAVAPSSTTTEAPKKIGPVIRPFRSNDDFLNSLKRRQMDAKKNRAERQEHRSKPQHVEQNTDDEQAAQPAAAPVAAAKSAKPAPGGALARRNKFSKNAKPEPQPEEQEAEGSEQEDKAEAKPKRPAHPRITLRKRA